MTIALTPLLRRNRWLTYLLQQAAVFLLSFGFVTGVKMLTGKSIQAGKQAMGPLEYLGMLMLFAGLIAFSRWMYFRIQGPNAASLGLALTRRRALDLVLGIAGGFLWFAWPKLLGLLDGTLRVKETIFSQGSVGKVALLLAAGALTLVANSVMEEVCNRAFPLQLWRERGLAFRLIFPALMFAAMHLAVEPFNAQAFLSRTLAGLAFAALYLLTDNIWLAAGVHTGGNEAVLFTTSRWQMGGLVSVDGTTFGPDWFSLVLWAALFAGALGVLVLRERKATVSPGQPFATAV